MIRILRQDPVDQQMRRLFVRALALLLCALALYTPVVQAQSADEKPVNPQPRGWAGILVGVPGDDAHARQFAKTADRWQNWLTESLDFPPQQVLRLPTVLAERDAMAKVVAEQETDAPASTGEIMRLAYFQGADSKDPLVSPVDHPQVLAKFPATLLVTATRDMALSSALYTQRQLVNAGVETNLHVWDGLQHFFFGDVDLPESQEAFRVVVDFFDDHLAGTPRTSRR